MKVNSMKMSPFSDSFIDDCRCVHKKSRNSNNETQVTVLLTTTEDENEKRVLRGFPIIVLNFQFSIQPRFLVLSSNFSGLQFQTEYFSSPLRNSLRFRDGDRITNYSFCGKNCFLVPQSTNLDQIIISYFHVNTAPQCKKVHGKSS
jgi:hypothetical protein